MRRLQAGTCSHAAFFKRQPLRRIGPSQYSFQEKNIRLDLGLGRRDGDTGNSADFACDQSEFAWFRTGTIEKSIWNLWWEVSPFCC
jgi:hypothetical protein